MKNKTLIKLALIGSLALNLHAELTRDATKQIVTDSASGLMWQDDSDAKTITKTWAEAIIYCEAKELGGYTDWRLPNYNEIYHLADRSRFNPAISPVFTQIVSDGYWSSTTSASGTSNAWNVYFNVGGDDSWDNKALSIYVRCVRAGQ
jgi:hypothetical protein